MRDNDDGFAELVDADQQIHDLAAHFRVNIACRLVCNDYFGIVDKCAGKRDALLFTAGAAEVIAKSVFKAYTSNGATLSVLLYLRAFEDGDFDSAWAIGAVLLVLVLAINLAARLAKTKLKQKQ